MRSLSQATFGKGAVITGRRSDEGFACVAGIGDGGQKGRGMNNYRSRRMVEIYRGMASHGLSVPEQYCLGLVPASHRASVLDIGVGGGRTTGPLLKIFDKYIGVDYSDRMIAAAKSLFPTADLRTMDARRLALSERFDCVLFSFNGIDCVEYFSRSMIFQQIAARLRPGGYLIYSTHNLDNNRVRDWYSNFFARELFQYWPRLVPVFRSIVNRGMNYWRQSYDETRAFAHINDCGQDFRSVNTYVDVQRELETLLPKVGFTVLSAIGNTRTNPGYGKEDSWVYVVAQLSS